MHSPPLLKPGDRVIVVSPSAKPDAALLERGCRVMAGWGLEPLWGTHTVDSQAVYLASSDANRLADFQDALDRPDVKAVFCARGGYGATRIVDQLDFSRFLSSPKWVIGFSDITALHLRLHQLGMQSLHACMPVRFAQAAYRRSVGRLRELLFSPNPYTVYAKPDPFNRAGQSSGPLIGGNLSLLADAMGSSAEPDTDNKILVIEEVSEPLYRVDRMMNQLKRAGKLDRLAGLVLGYFSQPRRDKAVFDESLQEIVLSKVAHGAYPVAFRFPIGHQAPNLPFKHSAVATLSVGTDGASLRF